MLPYLAFGALIWPAFLSNTAQEDALISARYSRNLAAGSGLVYNIDQKVLGTTTPAWSAAAAFVFRLPIPDSIRIRIIQVCSGTLALLAVLILSGGLRFSSESRRTAFIVLVLMTPTVTHALVAGMETGAVMLISAVLWRCLSTETLSGPRRWYRVALASALLAIRLDSVCIIAALWTAYSLNRGRRQHAVLNIARGVAGDVLAVTAFVIAYFTVCYSYYGQIVPQSMVAKANAIGIASLSPVARLWRWPGLVASLAGLNYPWPTRLSGLVQMSLVWYAMWFIGFGVAFHCTRPVSRRRFLLESAGIYLAVYSFCFVAGNAGVYPWYAHTPALLFCGAVLAALSETDVKVPLAKVIHGLLVVGLCAIAVLVMRSRIARLHDEGVLRTVGDRLRMMHAKSVMLEPIGYIGFYSNAYVYDLGGLVSPEMFAYRRAQEVGWFAKATRRFMPEYIVLRHGEMELNLGWNVGVLFDSEMERREWESSYRRCETVGDTRNSLESYDIYCRIVS